MKRRIGGTIVTLMIPALMGCGSSSNAPGLQPSVVHASQLSAGAEHAQALRSDNTVIAWGRNHFGQLGSGSTLDNAVPSPVLGSGGTGLLTDIAMVASGEVFSASLKEDGTVWTYGSNEWGSLGDNSITGQSTTPIQVRGVAGVGMLQNVRAISAGNGHVIAILDDNTVRSWGYNSDGELGDGTSSNHAFLPVLLKGPSGGNSVMDRVAYVAAGGWHTLLLREDGSVFACGYNGQGELGIGTTSRTEELPVQVVGPGGAGFLDNIVAVATGESHSLALKSDGTVLAWGMNDSGQLGDNSVLFSTVPLPVRGPGGSGFLTGVVAITGGWDFTVAVRNDGTVWAWGNNGFGQLGNGTNISSPFPVQVLGPGGSGFLGAVATVSAGDNYVTAMQNDGTLSSWGGNGYGQVGDGTTDDRTAPVPVLVP